MVVEVLVELDPLAGVDAAAGEDVVEVDVEVDLLVPPAGEGFTIVVWLSALAGGAPAAGATVSVFCSHAAKSAALARMQMYFFILLDGRPVWIMVDSENGTYLALPRAILQEASARMFRLKWRLMRHSMRFTDSRDSQFAAAGINAAKQCRLLLTRTFEP